ncbi:phosphatidate cytidylyltransferase [Aminobacterium mobile]|jgi:phosphatidate cytidylyltransferase
MVAFKAKSRELALRAFSGFIIGALILSAIYYGGRTWFLLASIISLISLWEYYQLLSKKFRVSKGIGFLAGILVLLASAEYLRPASILIIFTLTSFVLFMIEILRRQFSQVSYAIWNVGGTLSGLIYIILPWSYMVLLRAHPIGRTLLFSLFLCTWSCDIAAYLVGTRWGRNKFCEAVSPKKTWEGFAGGAGASILISAAVAYHCSLPPIPLLGIGAICGIAGQLGDLVESLIKREVEVKDSGHLIPGHGGFLDRFDSILINGTLTFFLFGVILS